MSTSILKHKPSINSSRLGVPILFLFFNRLSVTKKVFNTIKEAKPMKIYLASDGPREGDDNELEIVESVRDYVLSNIDWDCEIHTLFQNKNLGCKYACSRAVKWFFENEEMGIVLEDDTMPDKSFFKYCENLLNHYKNDKRIGMIGGHAPINNHNASESYYFSKYVRFWGWASWRRAWDHYDVELSNFDKLMEAKVLSSSTLSSREERYWSKVAKKLSRGELDTWDFQWLLVCLSQSMLTIVPSVNLVSNLGFGPDATHTLNIDSAHNNGDSFEMTFPLSHPNFILYNKFFDEKLIESEFLPSFQRRVIFRFSKKLSIRKNKFFS